MWSSEPQRNRTFSSSKNCHFQKKAKCKVILSCDNKFYLHENKKNHFLINGFALLNLTLKQWLKELSENSEMAYIDFKGQSFKRSLASV